MRGITLHRFLVGFATVTLLATAVRAHAAEVRALRLSTSADATRAVFDVSGALDYKLFAIANPDRIVLDLRASTFAGSFSAPAAKGVLKSVRTGKQGKDDVRVVFDLATEVQPKSFLMPASGKQPARLVVELAPRRPSGAGIVKSAEIPPEKVRDVVIAIDAGHGGADPGALGSAGTREKEITLAVARELKRLIDKQQGMSAVLTRDNDVFIPLKERYQIAREEKADLFVSIHADAFAREDARGSSVWMLSSRGATSEAARWLEDRENRADLVGGVSLDNKDNTLAAVLLDLSQGATLEASGAVANQVLHALGKIGPTHRGYVEKANFVVLRSPDVPSILVETAFITNPAEEKRLKNPEQREKLASAILDGLRSYFVAVPPPGTWFAANAHRDKPGRLSTHKATTVAVIADDDPDREVLARSPQS
jgi:N-acetylmuramoyl-L-alanine amidase